jgi:hypothetical protein
MTRALGDEVGHSIGVTAEPELMTAPLSRDDRYLLLCSDGLTEFMSDQVRSSLSFFLLFNMCEFVAVFCSSTIFRFFFSFRLTLPFTLQ